MFEHSRSNSEGTPSSIDCSRGSKISTTKLSLSDQRRSSVAASFRAVADQFEQRLGLAGLRRADDFFAVRIVDRVTERDHVRQGSQRRR